MAEYTQVYGIINAMYSQATGKTDLTAVDSSSFVSVATKTLATGYDNFMNAMSTVLSRSIFAWRDYDEKFKILDADNQRFGNHVRKISPLDDDAVTNDEYSLTDGQSYDPWTVKKPKVAQFNYYDKKTWARWISLPKYQIDGAVSGPDEFARFVAMVLGNMRNQIKQDREDTKRLTFVNHIMATYQDAIYNSGANANQRVVNLLTEYNTLTGGSYTDETIFLPANYTPFIQWASSRIMNVSEHMTERGYRFHKNITGTNIPRFTPKKYQKFAVFSDYYTMIENSSFSNTFHEKYVKGFEGFEAVNFLQSSKDGERNKISLSSYVGLADNGTVYTAASGSYTLDNFFGVIFDRDAMLLTTVNEWTQSTGMNARAGYENLWYHYTHRYCNDQTENICIFLLA